MQRVVCALGLSLACAFPAAAHHGKDFLMVEAYELPHPRIVYFVSSEMFSHTADGDVHDGTVVAVRSREPVRGRSSRPSRSSTRRVAALRGSRTGRTPPVDAARIIDVMEVRRNGGVRARAPSRRKFSGSEADRCAFHRRGSICDQSWSGSQSRRRNACRLRSWLPSGDGRANLVGNRGAGPPRARRRASAHPRRLHAAERALDIQSRRRSWIGERKTVRRFADGRCLALLSWSAA